MWTEKKYQLNARLLAEFDDVKKYQLKDRLFAEFDDLRLKI